MLSLVIFLPLLLTVPIVFLRGRRTVFWYTTAATFVEFLLSLFLLKGFDFHMRGFQWVEHARWLPDLAASYHLGVDGLSLSLILLTTFLTFVATLSSLNYIQKQVKEYYITLLILETGMLGVFAALDLLLFFVFWEVMLLPMYLLIGIWGHERRIYAAFKFVLYTMAGSAFLLTAIIVLRLHTGTFDLVEMMNRSGTLVPAALEGLLFLAFALAFAIKVPLFPFHTWLPDAHVEAPTAGSVILAGVLLKMGVYGFLRFNFTLFPQASHHYAPLFMALGIVGILYGALMSWVQEDLKKLIAYSSVAHLGFVILGIFTFTDWGLQGGILQMVNHGLSTGGLFLAAGLLYERKHTRDMARLRGIGKAMPVFSVLFGIVMLSSVGLPGLNGFVGEFLILLGAYKVSLAWAAFGVLGVILAAVYLLTMFQKVVLTAPTPETRHLKDVSPREFVVFALLLVFIFWIGVYPAPFLRFAKAPSRYLQENVKGAVAAETVPVMPAHQEVQP